MEDTHTPKWADEIPAGEFISTQDSLKGAGTFLNLFDEYKMPCEETGDVRYFLHDPVKHGYEAGKQYPLIVFFHGLKNSLAGKMCISYSGAEMFATEKYQEQMGGAYVLVPLANEKPQANGSVTGSWSKDYLKPVHDIITRVCERHDCGKLFAVGGSMGGWFTWRFCEAYPIFAGIMPVSSNYIAPSGILDMFKEKNIAVYCAMSAHDEFMEFRSIKSQTPLLDKYDNVMYWFPEFLKNGDGGIASLYTGGVEMGQHCVIIQVQGNLIYDDGKPYDERLPNGVTGWIKSLL